MSLIRGPSTKSASGIEHFVALDSIRGLLACAVALFHMRSTSKLSSLPFVQHSWLFVDFFFVLSGFVIAASYGDRLASGFPVSRFMVLRVGRVYPLHLAVLLVLLGFESINYVVGASESGGAPFTGDFLPGAFFTNLTLTQVFGLHDHVTWNSPSWSIAAEVWTYLIAAMGLSLLGGRFRYALAATAMLAPVILVAIDAQGLDRTYSWALVRCLYGFSLGMIAYTMHRRWARVIIGRSAMTAIELAIIAATAILVSYAVAGRSTLLFPVLFTAAVITFARDAGAISRLLATKPLRLLGALSYSIYMIHVVIISKFEGVVGIAGRLTHLELTTIVMRNGLPVNTICGPGFVPDALTIICLALIVACAWPTYRFIEIPCRDLSRNLSKRMG